MIRSIKKGRIYVEVSREGAWTSDGLQAESIALESDPLLIRIDLSSNLSRRNRAANSYADARAVEEEISTLEKIEIQDDWVSKRLAQAIPDLLTSPVELDLELQLASAHRLRAAAQTGSSGKTTLRIVKT